MKNNQDAIGAIIISLVACGLLAVGFYVLLSWLSVPVLSNDEIIKEVKKCEEAGLKANTLHSNISFRVTTIQCEPKL